MLEFWTDGSANPNPGPGGFAVIEVKNSSAQPIILGREENSSNIRMEGTAIIRALEYANGKPCEIHTDSEFWLKIMTKWMSKWAANGWTKKSAGKIKNLDLVKKLYKLYNPATVKLYWEKGHAGIKYNELADHWANKARKGANIPS